MFLLLQLWIEVAHPMSSVGPREGPFCFLEVLLLFDRERRGGVKN